MHGIFERSGSFPCHSLTVLVLMYSPSQVMLAAMQSLVCGRQFFKMSSIILSYYKRFIKNQEESSHKNL